MVTDSNSKSSPQIYMVTDSNGNCDLAFMQIDLPEGYGPGMLLGEVFMRHYFTVFSREKGEVRGK